jgi:hypothetical protein
MSLMQSLGGTIAGALIALTAAGDAASLEATRVGIVHRGELDDLRLTITQTSLPLGSTVAIVTAPEGTVLCCAVVGAPYALRPDEFDPVSLDGQGQTTYALDAGGIADEVSLGFGVTDVSPDLASSGGRLDLDGNGTPEGFRSCASGEGLHLTVWYGEPLTTARLWHGYFYLGYDTESDCLEQDYE